MIQVATLGRSWAGVTWLLIAAGLLGALVFGNTLILFAMFAAAVAAGLMFLRGQAAVLPALQTEAAQVEVGGAAYAAREPRAQRTVLLADGTARQAQVVPVPAVEGYQVVLTIDGYALVNDDGRIVYALNRVSHAPMSDPVVVTILDTEVTAY
jgi:hypothetical protein